jgi:glycosyltransferase involved in cell wall biosynthesis
MLRCWIKIDEKSLCIANNLQINRGLIHPMKEELPLVSIVTPSYNKGKFIEETILSIKNQTYHRIEHIIIDGGSTNDTIDIIKEYEGTYNMQWVSEPDEGQSDAINKGWRMAKGEIIAYLNSDDTYVPRAVETAVNYLTEHPDVNMVYGKCNIINEHSKVIRQFQATEFDLVDMVCGLCGVPQPAVFLRRKVLEGTGYLDIHLHMAMDADLWIRIGLKFKIKYIPQLLANFRMYPGTKSVDEAYKFGHDHLHILNKLFSDNELPKEVRGSKRRAYSYVHLDIGLGYYSQRQMKQARKHLIKSVILYPLHLKRPVMVGILVTSLLGKKATEIASNWNSKLSGKWL